MHGRQRRLSRAWAFDVEGRPLGEFRNRREAIGAVTARDHFETQTRASSGNVTTDFVARRRAEARAAETAWKHGLSQKQRKRLPARIADPHDKRHPGTRKGPSKAELRALAAAAIGGRA